MESTAVRALMQAKERIVQHFTRENWEELGLLTGMSKLITGHDRLLRSLYFGDDDYSGSALSVLCNMVDVDPKIINIINTYIDGKFPESHFSDEDGQCDSINISSVKTGKHIVFSPTVFSIPDTRVEVDLVAVMMPFSKEFDPVYAIIKDSVAICNLRCLRADSIWESSTIIQDVFSLIFRSRIVIVDFTGRNPNVMYETGIAHTLGKHVVPVTQSLDDVPFDMKHHRVLRYLPNKEGLTTFKTNLTDKLHQWGFPF